jgi:redox-sensitive bicupin YhaK (pirin superfamily)
MAEAIELMIQGRAHELSPGLTVRRVLPQVKRRMVGPFIFFDHMGPASFAPGTGMDVRPHPHIGLATVTYLFEGEIMHRDSLGYVQPIVAGDVNWMTAGRGIVHSERTRPELRLDGFKMHGIQTWVALPLAHEDTAPAFEHIPAKDLPAWEEGGAKLRLIVGTYAGRKAPTTHFSPIFYVAAEMAPGARIVLSDEHAERAAYVAEGAATVGGQSLAVGDMAIAALGASVEVVAGADGAKVMLCGGAPMDGPRHIWWNFVASSKELIEDAKQRWRDQTFGTVPGESEFIPLPER